MSPFWSVGRVNRLSAATATFRAVSLAETTPVAEPATLPSIEEIERASAFAREPFLTEGEDAASALAPGTPRRRALDSALEELEAGAKVPSPHWRRQWSLLLGLERLLSQDEPHLVDGTVLSAHQVDALSGTLTALLADRLKNGDGPSAPAAEPVLDADEPPPPPEDDEDDDDEEEVQEEQWTPDEAEAEDVAEAPEDPNAGKRFWFEHATGAGKTVAAVGFVEASRTGGILILTHRRNLVDQFHGELRDRGYAKRIAPALLGHEDTPNGPVTVETYQWFVRNAGNISDAYSIVICDEAHTALGEKTSAAIRAWTGPVFVGMTATGALIARHVTDLFPTQTSRFDLAQAARRGVISPLRCVRIPPGPGVRTIAKVPLRRGEVDTEFDQEMLAQLLDQLPFNLAIADLYKTRFNGVPGVVYAAGVRHAYNVAQAFRDLGMKAQAVSGETPKRELAQILARYERGDIDVLVNAQLLAEGWNSPRATVCMHLAPTASKRIYQQRVGRVTRRHLGKEAGIVVDFVHPATKHDDPVVTLHSLLDRDVYRGGAIVVGPVRRGRGRRLRVERRVLPVTSEENRRIEVFERELWRIAVEHLDYGEQVQWAALAGARVAPTGWRRARAMLHFDQGGELKRTFLITAVDRNKNPQLRLRALQEIASGPRRRGVRPRAGLRRVLAARRQARGRQGRPAGAGREEDRPPRPGQQLDLALREHDARGPRGVRRPALARDEAAARPARELVGWRACAQRAPSGAPGAAAGPASVGRAAGRRDPAHRRGGRGHQRRPHPDVPQARRAGAGAAAQLPEGPRQDQAPPSPQGRGGRDGAGRRAGRRGRHGAVLDDELELDGVDRGEEGRGRADASRRAASQAGRRRPEAAPRRGRSRRRPAQAEPPRRRRVEPRRSPRTPRSPRASRRRAPRGRRRAGRRSRARPRSQRRSRRRAGRSRSRPRSSEVERLPPAAGRTPQAGRRRSPRREVPVEVVEVAPAKPGALAAQAAPPRRRGRARRAPAARRSRGVGRAEAGAVAPQAAAPARRRPRRSGSPPRPLTSPPRPSAAQRRSARKRPAAAAKPRAKAKRRRLRRRSPRPRREAPPTPDAEAKPSRSRKRRGRVADQAAEGRRPRAKRSRPRSPSPPRPRQAQSQGQAPSRRRPPRPSRARRSPRRARRRRDASGSGPQSRTPRPSAWTSPARSW